MDPAKWVLGRDGSCKKRESSDGKKVKVENYLGTEQSSDAVQVDGVTMMPMMAIMTMMTMMTMITMMTMMTMTTMMIMMTMITCGQNGVVVAVQVDWVSNGVAGAVRVHQEHLNHLGEKESLG